MKRPLFRKQWGHNPVAVNQANENKKVMIALKQFESVSNYCEEVKCRHETMAKHFGETETEKCGDRCDGCTIGKQVSRELDCLGKVGSCKTYTKMQYDEPNAAFDEYNPDLYGGKRGGFGFESAELGKDEGPGSAFPDESAADNTKFIMNEFKKRKGKANIPKGKEEEVDIHSGYSFDCPLDDPGSKSVAKLGWRVRLACYHQLHEALETNHVNGYLEQPEKAATCEAEVKIVCPMHRGN